MFQITERVKFNPARQTFQAAKKVFFTQFTPQRSREKKLLFLPTPTAEFLKKTVNILIAVQRHVRQDVILAVFGSLFRQDVCCFRQILIADFADVLIIHKNQRNILLPNIGNDIGNIIRNISVGSNAQLIENVVNSLKKPVAVK